eukprot:6182388-Pleurochrysis_carterae.AAC.3
MVLSKCFKHCRWTSGALSRVLAGVPAYTYKAPAQQFAVGCTVVHAPVALCIILLRYNAGQVIVSLMNCHSDAADLTSRPSELLMSMAEAP